MAWNNNSEIEQAVGWGDISQATHISNGDGTYTMGNMVNVSSSINPMARYKPVRHTNQGWLTAAQFAETRYGFYDPIHLLPRTVPLINEATPKNNWQYLKPRGINTTEASITGNEWFRSTDFLKEAGSSTGYNANIGCPIALELNGTAGSAGFAVLVWKDSYAASRYSKVWNSNEGLSLSELLAGGGSDMSDFYIVFLLIDNAHPSTDFVWVKTKVKISSFSTVEVFPMYGSDTYSGSVLYPGINFLNGTHSSGITIIAGLSPSAGSSTYPYEITTSYSGMYSMGFQDNCDRIIISDYENAYSIQGLTGGPVNTSSYPVYMSNPTAMTVSGSNYIRYNITVGNSRDGIYGLFSTPSNWGRTVSGHSFIYFDVTIFHQTGPIGTSTAPSGDIAQTFSNSGNASFPASASNQAVKLIGTSTFSSLYLWVPSGVPLSARHFTIHVVAHNIDSPVEQKTMETLDVYATA